MGPLYVRGHFFETGDFVNMAPGIMQYLYDYGPDICFLEIAMAGTPDGLIPEDSVEPFCETPGPKPWVKGPSSGDWLSKRDRE